MPCSLHGRLLRILLGSAILRSARTFTFSHARPRPVRRSGDVQRRPFSNTRPCRRLNGHGKSGDFRGSSLGSTDGGTSGGGNDNIVRSTWLDFNDFQESAFSAPLSANLSMMRNVSTTPFDVMPSAVRGGGRLTKEKPNMIASITNYWVGVMGSAFRTLTSPFTSLGKRTSSLFKSKQVKYEEELMEQLRTMPIRRVTVPNSTVLPVDVVQIAAKRSGLLGSPLKSELVQDLAQSLKRWYLLQGYILHCVTDATLRPETATAEITVQEPVNHNEPLGLSFYKEMVVDPDSGELLTYRQYKERHQQRRTLGGDDIQKSDLNTTFVPTTGWTKAHRLAVAMGMAPGQPFQWDHVKWQKIVTSGLFGHILQATPRPMGDGTVQMHIVVTEAPSKHLEYGVGKSLYSGGWEGELDFEHANLCGGGETLGVNVRRGTTEAKPSVRLKFGHGRLGLEGGYDIEAFSEYIGEDKEKVMAEPTTAVSSSSPTPAVALVDDDYAASEETATIDTSTREPTTSAYTSSTTDWLVDRRGATFRVKNPIDTCTIRNSVASASLERTTTRSGMHETIGSTTIEVGPFTKELPMDARSNVDFSFTTGAKLGREVSMFNPIGGDVDNGQDEAAAVTSSSQSLISAATSILPYVSVSATTRQLFPLFSSSKSSRAVTSQQRRPNRPLLLALRHSVTASTNTVPRHMAMAIGTSNHVRGTPSNGHVSSAVRGTTELRVPIQLPSRLQMGQPDDASVVLYGDWLLSAKDSSSPIVRKSSVGIGLRKSIQGFPLQYDVTYSNDGKVKAMFGLGRDFVF